MDRLGLNGHFNHGQTSAEPNVLSILSGKGGVGKTVIAFNLAERIAALGRRVLLVDGDISCGNLHILANVACDFGLEEFATGRLSLKEAVFCLNHHFDLLAAVRNACPVDLSDAGEAIRFVDKLRSQSTAYDFVVIDHCSGVSKGATVMAHASALTLLVLVPELTSIADCYGLYKDLIKANRSIDCRLLINRSESTDDADFVHKKFEALTERFLNCPIRYLGHLPEDSSFRRCVAAQTPISELAPNSVAAQAINKLAEVLARESRQLLAEPTANRERTINIFQAVADIRE